LVNGTDEVSLKAFEFLKQGRTIKNISEQLNITLDQSKKLSQLYRMYELINELPEVLKDKLKALGFKAFVLNPLLKEMDIEGLKEILQSINIDVKR
jgi:hypothetical protein